MKEPSRIDTLRWQRERKEHDTICCGSGSTWNRFRRTWEIRRIASEGSLQLSNTLHGWGSKSGSLRACLIVSSVRFIVWRSQWPLCWPGWEWVGSETSSLLKYFFHWHCVVRRLPRDDVWQRWWHRVRSLCRRLKWSLVAGRGAWLPRDCWTWGWFNFWSL